MPNALSSRAEQPGGRPSSRAEQPGGLRSREISGTQSLAAAGLIFLAACSSAPGPAPPSAPAPAVTPGAVREPLVASAPAPAPPVPLPPIPKVTGPLVVRVIYPLPNQQLTTRDTNFIFGSVGSGDATLTINDIPVPVEPNGAFLAWIPVPPAAPAPVTPRGAPISSAIYRIVAAQGSDTARATHVVRLVAPRIELSNTGKLELDGGSIAPRAPMQLPPHEPVRVSVRAPANANVYVRDSAGTVYPLRNSAALGVIRGIAGFDSTGWSVDVPARALASAKARLIVQRGADSIGSSLSLVKLLDDEIPQLGALRPTLIAGGDTDAVTIVRPTAGGTYRWQLFPGTVVPITGRVGNSVRIRLDRGLEAWVEDADISPLPSGAPAPRRTLGTVRSVSSAEWVDIVMPTADRPPFLVTEDGRQIVVTLYATTPASENVGMPAGDPLVKSVRYEQPATDRARIVVDLNDDPYGYMVLWSGSAVVLRLRRPPRVDAERPLAERPLAGLTIGVDPGHPPIGSTGPTGFYEGDATLAIGQRLKAMLEERGATVFMIRATADPVALNDRATMARRANVHALVSIHLNALPDGANPLLSVRGTGTYHYYPHSQPLAQQVQRALVRRLGLHDEGVYYQNLAVARNPWFPAILCEGAYIMRPDHEAALRTSEFQGAYALGVVEGLEGYFRSRRRP